jgi:agmatinase
MKTIQINPYLELTDPVSGQIRNTETGRVFRLSLEALSVISLFCEPKEISEDLEGLEDIVNSDDTDAMKAFVENLLEQGILVRGDNYSDIGKYGTSIQLSNRALVEKPFLSCLSVPVASLDSEYPYDFAILGLPFDLGSTGFPGSRFGPSRLRELSSTGADYRATFSDLSCAGWPSEYGKKVCEGKLIVDVGDVIHQVGESFESFFRRIENAVGVLGDRRAFPISIGGDHSCLYPLVRCATRFIRKKVHLVVFDAHTDLADYDASISHNHGNVVSRLLVEKVIQKVTHVGLRGMVGKPTVRDGYTPIYADQCVSSNEVCRLIPFDSTEAVYVSFDVDVIDPVFAPGTGTPVPLGLTPQVVLSSIQQIFASQDVVGFDIVEYNPMRDINDMTGNLLIHMLPQMLDSLRSKQKVD